MRLDEISWKEAQKAKNEKLSVIIPIGAMTQYGYHLPLGTNVMISHEIAIKVADITNVVVAPPLWYGYAYPQPEATGTITIYPDVLQKYLYQIVRSLAQQGFTRFVFFYGQLPNITSLNHVAQLITEEFPATKIAIVAWWQLGKKSMREEFKDDPGYHAMSSETALMMVLKPDLVQKDKIIDEMPKVSIGYDLYPRPEATSTESGVKGKPSLATKDKGEILLNEIINNFKDMLENDLVFRSVWELL